MPDPFPPRPILTTPLPQTQSVPPPTYNAPWNQFNSRHRTADEEAQELMHYKVDGKPIRVVVVDDREHKGVCYVIAIIFACVVLGVGIARLVIYENNR